jgi:hypothetical protein
VETATHVLKMAANFRDKRTSITTKQAFAIFLSPLISHSSLPLTHQKPNEQYYLKVVGNKKKVGEDVYSC